jgi:hypothetical protein
MRQVIGILILAILTFSCGKNQNQATSPPEESNLSGEELAKIHCSSCHKYPDPGQLPTAFWVNSVLPNMGYRLGIGDYFGNLMTKSPEERDLIIENSIYLAEPVIHQKDWEKIVAFYAKNSPKEFPRQTLPSIKELKSFIIKNQDYKGNEIVLGQFDSKNSVLNISEAVSNELLEISKSKTSQLSLGNKFPVVDFDYHSNYGKVWLEIGNMNPNDLKQGKLRSANKVLLDSLKRPVDLMVADMNGDKVDDFVISCFGNHLGDLSWYDGLNFTKHPLLELPGARVSYFFDLDHDGQKDVIALMTQARESIVFFKNKGKGEFEMQKLLEFVPNFGSSYFELADIDGDQDPDIVNSNGDNADLSITLKPYHGIRIFINDGKNNFSEKFFFPQNGASKVLARDFDNDGDLDLASISYFPDLLEKESFLYFENKGKLNFEVSTFSKFSKLKFLTLDAGDFDKDGDLDIVLGAFDRSLAANSGKARNVFVLLNKKP